VANVLENVHKRQCIVSNEFVSRNIVFYVVNRIELHVYTGMIIENLLTCYVEPYVVCNNFSPQGPSKLNIT